MILRNNKKQEALCNASCLFIAVKDIPVYNGRTERWMFMDQLARNDKMLVRNAWRLFYLSHDAWAASMAEAGLTSIGSFDLHHSSIDQGANSLTSRINISFRFFQGSCALDGIAAITSLISWMLSSR